MTPGNAVWLGAGFMVGVATWFTQTDIPQDHCGVYKVENKVKTAYVLKPPPAPAPEHLFCPSPIAPQPKVEEAKVEEPVAEEEKPRRRRHRRHRRYW